MEYIQEDIGKKKINDSISKFRQTNICDARVLPNIPEQFNKVCPSTFIHTHRAIILLILGQILCNCSFHVVIELLTLI